MFSMQTIDLRAFKRSFFSQNGEDGILQKIFDECSIDCGVFCELGAWDGRRLSNTYHFYRSGWSGVYIEGDIEKFSALKRNISRQGVDLVCTYVRPDGPDSLDAVLGRTSAVGKTGRLDLLSIDIDSDDLLVWQALRTFRSLVVVIEFNPTIPLDVRFVNPLGQNVGNSPYSIYEFALVQKYDLVAVTECNLIFVDAARRPQTIKVLGLHDKGLFLDLMVHWLLSRKLKTETRPALRRYCQSLGKMRFSLNLLQRYLEGSPRIQH